MLPEVVKLQTLRSFISSLFWKTSQRIGRRSTSTGNRVVGALKKWSDSFEVWKNKWGLSLLGISAMEFLLFFPRLPKRRLFFKCFYEKNFIYLNFFPRLLFTKQRNWIWNFSRSETRSVEKELLFEVSHWIKILKNDFLW